MKSFTIIQTGYTAGIYGNSGNYFTLLWITRDMKTGDITTETILFHGMYGPEQRVKRVMEELGYTYFYTNTVYGQLKRKDLYPNMKDEKATIEYIKLNVK